MSTIGGTTWDTATPLPIGTTSDQSPIGNYTPGSAWPYCRAWWTVTPSADGTVTLDTFATVGYDNPDTDLTVFTGSSEATAVQVAHNDDAAGHGYLSQVSFAATAGTTYYVRVGCYYSDGYGITSYALTAAVAASATPAPNDHWANAIAINVGDTSAPQPAAGNTLDPGETGYGGLGRTAWWRFDATADTMVRFDTQLSSSGADTWIGLFTGTAVNALTRVAQAGHFGSLTTSQLDYRVSAGTTYWIAVDTQTTSAFDIVLRLTGFTRVSAVITCGDADTQLYPSGNTSTGRVIGSYSGTTGGVPDNYADLLAADAATPAGALASDDMSSFYDLDNATFDSDMAVRYGRDSAALDNGGYGMSVVGRADSAATAPSTWDYFNIRAIATVQCDYTDTTHSPPPSFDVTLSGYRMPGDPGYDGSGVDGSPSVNLDLGGGNQSTSWQRFVGAWQSPFSTDQLFTALAARQVSVRLSFTEYTVRGHDYAAYLAFEVEWWTVGVQAAHVRTWLRENQRGDKGGAPIRTVQNNSRQNSLRNIAFR